MYIIFCLIISSIYKAGVKCHSYDTRDDWYLNRLRSINVLTNDYDTSRNFAGTKFTMFLRLIFAAIMAVLTHFVGTVIFNMVFFLLCTYPSVQTNIRIRKDMKVDKCDYESTYELKKHPAAAHTVGMFYTVYLWIVLIALKVLW